MAQVSCFEVVAPFYVRKIDGLGTERFGVNFYWFSGIEHIYFELSFWEPGVCILKYYFMGRVLWIDEDCQKDIWSYCHWQDREIGVVDMFALKSIYTCNGGYD